MCTAVDKEIWPLVGLFGRVNPVMIAQVKQQILASQQVSRLTTAEPQGGGRQLGHGNCRAPAAQVRSEGEDAPPQRSAGILPSIGRSGGDRARAAALGMPAPGDRPAGW